jgi:hypothetical protein
MGALVALLQAESLPRVAKARPASDNQFMPEDRQEDRQEGRKGLNHAEPARGPFLQGAMVVVTLGDPREKIWGMILSLSPEGLSLSGIELASFEDFVLMVKEGEAFSPAVVFFPMHRIERVELDLPDGNLPSLSQRFSAKTALDAAALLSSVHSKKADGESSANASDAGDKDPA